jgi:hypothetical protein
MTLVECFIPIYCFVFLYVVALCLVYLVIRDDRFQRSASVADFATVPTVVGVFVVVVNCAIASTNTNLIISEFIVFGISTHIGIATGTIFGAVAGYNLRHGYR